MEAFGVKKTINQPIAGILTFGGVGAMPYGRHFQRKETAPDADGSTPKAT